MRYDAVVSHTDNNCTAAGSSSAEIDRARLQSVEILKTVAQQWLR